MPQTSSHILFLALTACTVAGCASRPAKEISRTSYASDGSVKAEVVPAPDGARYEVTPGIGYISPEPASQNALPQYPPELLAKNLDPIEVIARVVVNALGSVETVTLVRSTSQEPAFSDRVLATVNTWTFTPLQRVEGLNAQPIPFTQEYRFTFKQINGRAIVESGIRK